MRNAIDLAVSQGVAAAVDDLESRPDVAVIVVTGAGGVFSAGMDLKAFARGERPAIPGRGLCGLTDHEVSKPVIAAVEGFALAGGFEVALAADLIVASRAATFGVPEVTRGLVAAGGALLRMAKTMPYGAAMDLALTGDRFGAERAHALGLVTHLSVEGEALTDATRVARRIAAQRMRRSLYS
jgi:enoyl-CoA hydratase